MAITALNKVSPAWYTPECEREEEAPTKFKLRPLTPAERESVMDVMDAEGNLGIPPKNYGKVLRIGLLDWENFNDPETGKPMKASPVNHPRIPGDIRLELASEILIRSGLSEEEQKNS